MPIAARANDASRSSRDRRWPSRRRSGCWPGRSSISARSMRCSARASSRAGSRSRPRTWSGAAGTMRTGRASAAPSSPSSRSACSAWSWSRSAPCSSASRTRPRRMRSSCARRWRPARSMRAPTSSGPTSARSLQAQELEAKQRRAGLLKSSEELAAFFGGKLPADIHSSAALDAWYRARQPGRAGRPALVAGRRAVDARRASAREDFPTQLSIGGHDLRLEYRFVPGDPADGVTAQVPLALRQCAAGRRLRMAGAGPAGREGRRTDPRLAEIAAAQFRAGAGFRARLRRVARQSPAEASANARWQRRSPAYLKKVTGCRHRRSGFFRHRTAGASAHALRRARRQRPAVGRGPRSGGDPGANGRRRRARHSRSAPMPS